MSCFHRAVWVLARNPDSQYYFGIGKVGGLFVVTLVYLKSVISQLVHAVAIKEERAIYLHHQTEAMSL